MATVATTLTLAPLLQPLVVPDTIRGYREPFSICEFIGTGTVPAKISTNESTLTVTMALPIGFVFKLATINIHWLSTVAVDILDLVKATSFGVIGQGFVGRNQNLVIATRNDQTPIAFQLAGSNQMLFEEPVGNYQLPLQTGVFQGDNQLTWLWADASVDATVAITIFFRLRMLMYTIEQFRSYPMFDAVPTIQP